VTPPSGDESRVTVEVIGSWVIREDKVSSNTLFKVHGNIHLLPGVTWEMTDCEMIIMCEYARQYRMYWSPGSTLKTTRCKLGGYNDGTRFAPANFEAKFGTWIATDTEVHTCYAVSMGDDSVLIGERFMAGPNPDSIIISANARVSLKDSRFPLSISMHCMEGGEVTLDLPSNEPMTQVIDANKFLNGGGQYVIELENTVVPHWFIFARDISSAPEYKPALINIRRCENFLLSILTRDVTGEFKLPVNLEHPIHVGNATIQRDPAAAPGDVNMRMYGGLYFGGVPDAVAQGPAELVGGKPVHIAETMMWGGDLKIDGGPNKTILLNCTTMDVWGGNLTVESLNLGRTNGRSQIIVETTGTLTSRHCDFGPDLFVLTKDEGTAAFEDYQPGRKVEVETQGGRVQFVDPRLAAP
jgi:hypothetical protein